MSRWRSWWADTLSKRLFLLLWVTLVASHLLGFWLVAPARPHGPGAPPGPGHGPQGEISRHVLPPFLPPDALHGVRPGPPRHGHPHDTAHPAEAVTPGSISPGARQEAGPPPRGGNWRIALDYLVRVLVLGLAAWLGARWLTAPMRRLSEASRQLGQAMGRGGALPVLDDTRGPLEVRQTSQVFNGMARGLQAQFEQRSLMMAAVSHDLRTPLTRLRMRLETLRPDPVAERCVTDVQDINAMIDAVLDAMHQERQQEPLQPVDVLAMVQAMADDLQEAGQDVQASGEAVTLKVQPVAFKRILSNLISNAVRYGQGAQVRVAVQPQPPPGQVCITVDDHGPGIPPDQLETVFQPFVRLEGSRSRDTGGVGLGLYIARELALRHGGSITLLNRPEGGLRAELRVPAQSG